ncbi:unnamed protein product [Trichogramma brassicae]|uniref:Uncharacterized protein n=1 Tax=Trichogramma brassicae TaxID=86971 RepID=A0A6H5I8K5_9HYME|nr:unnamed protein product [Trichogramma brassicae]
MTPREQTPKRDLYAKDERLHCVYDKSVCTSARQLPAGYGSYRYKHFRTSSTFPNNNDRPRLTAVRQRVGTMYTHAHIHILEKNIFKRADRIQDRFHGQGARDNTRRVSLRAHIDNCSMMRRRRAKERKFGKSAWHESSTFRPSIYNNGAAERIYAHDRGAGNIYRASSARRVNFVGRRLIGSSRIYDRFCLVSVYDDSSHGVARTYTRCI